MDKWALLTGEQANEKIHNEKWEYSSYGLVFEFYLDLKNIGKDNRVTLFLNHRPEELVYHNFSYYLFVNKQLLRSETILNTFATERRPSTVKIDGLDRSYIFHLIKMMLKNSQLRNSQLGEQFVSSITEQLLLLIEINNDSGRSPVRLNPVNRYNLIAVNFLDQVSQEIRNHKTVHYYVEKLGVSEKTLSKATRITLKITPKGLIQKKLAQEAMDLLEHTDKTVKEIGFELGVDEVNNFSSFFKRMTDMTPSEYRKIKKQEPPLS